MFDAPILFFDLNSTLKQELIVAKGCASCSPSVAVKIHTYMVQWQLHVHVSDVISAMIQHFMKPLRL